MVAVLTICGATPAAVEADTPRSPRTKPLISDVNCQNGLVEAKIVAEGERFPHWQLGQSCAQRRQERRGTEKTRFRRRRLSQRQARPAKSSVGVVHEGSWDLATKPPRETRTEDR